MEAIPDSLPPSPVVAIRSGLFDQHGLRVLIKRDDLLQPGGDQRLCGNKVRKLKYNLSAARQQGFGRVLTFGGAFSNHLAAVARAGSLYGFETIGMVRGEARQPLNPTLAQAEADGMVLHYLDRQTYRNKHTLAITERLRRQFGPCYILPEGGANEAALQGCAEMVPEIIGQLGGLPDFLCVACGTGATLAGLIRGAGGRGRLIGVSALKGDFLQREVQQWLGSPSAYRNWTVEPGYHFGGYARFPAELRTFVREFENEHGILLDPIYTSKLVYGVTDLIGRGAFPAGSSVLIIHTGGLQGWSGFTGAPFHNAPHPHT